MNIYDLTKTQLEEYFQSKGENKSKSGIVLKALYKERISNFNEIVMLSERVKMMLCSDFNFTLPSVIKCLENADTAKLLFKLSDGNLVEAVLMRHDYGNGLCISTQIGCNMGCVFCESGRFKKVRSLEPCEMVGQIIQAENILGVKISHITLMGIGEPLDNYDNVMKLIDIVGFQQGLDIAPRHITVSTCGLIPEIRRMSDENIQCNLAVSLHAADDITRSRLMPINKVYGLNNLLEEIRIFSAKKNKKTTLEYILLDGINDGEDSAFRLCDILKGIKCYVNLIPYNETNNLDFKRSSSDRILSFYHILINGGIRATIRREFGHELKAACGQLKSEYTN